MKKQTDQQLSPHFKRSEFACNCNCGSDTIDVETLMICETVRNYVDKPITPSSGHRCQPYNYKVGGSVVSEHLEGRAVDLPVPNPYKVYKMLCKKYPNQYGFGVYDTFVHVDSRTHGPARWDNRKIKTK